LRPSGDSGVWQWLTRLHAEQGASLAPLRKNGARMRYDPERYHRGSIRLPQYDYAGNGTYFVTICTHERALLFGNINNGAMAMNELGWIAWEEWEKSAEIRKQIELGPFVVMPNHLHGIVTINPDNPVEAYGGAPRSEGRPVSETSLAAWREGASLAPLRRQSRSLGSLVAGFKQATTKRINDVRGTAGAPLWQRNYYERVGRNDDEIAKISAYIENNPMQWTRDRENDDRTGEDAFESSLYRPPWLSKGRP
jgi:putative transposase